MSNKISAVIFDMDGLMFDTERLAMKAWQEVAKPHGYQITEEIYLKTVGSNSRDTERIYRENFGEDFPYAELRKKRLDYAHNYIYANRAPIKMGLFPLLDFLDEQKIKKAVATSTERMSALRHIEHAGILERFDAIVCGDEVEKGKPEPDIFIAAAERLGVKPSECIVLEDSYNGLRAAYKAGMKPIMIPDLLQPNSEIKELTHQVFDSLEDVITFLQKAELK